MSPRKICLIVAFLFVGAFAVSLMLDWHGTFAVVFAMGFFLFVAASTHRDSLPRRVIGGMLVGFSIFSLIGSTHQNLVFVFTVVGGGAILFLNPLTFFTHDKTSNQDA